MEEEAVVGKIYLEQRFDLKRKKTVHSITLSGFLGVLKIMNV